MARIIISKNTINLDAIMQGTITGLAADIIDLENVTRLAIGCRVVYAEYLDENNNLCIRAYGRDEFATLVIFNGEDLAILPLKGELFERRDFNFVVKQDAEEQESVNEDAETIDE